MRQLQHKPLVVIITGLSGAGRSVAIKALEDSGFYCIDNLPLGMMNAAIEFIEHSQFDNYALGMDIRDNDFIKEFPALKKQLSEHLLIDLVFLQADEDVITLRYGTTRRKHPLLDTGGDLIASIRREKNLLSPIKEAADIKFDTSSWSPHYLARVIEQRYAGEGISRNLFVSIISFGFKHGQIRPADSIYDVRFLDNPYFIKELKNKTGLNTDVKKYIFNDPRTEKFLSKIINLNKFLLPNYYNEGKHYFRIGIGCTGGKHRSVAIAEELAKRLTKSKIPNTVISVLHRDLNEVDSIYSL